MSNTPPITTEKTETTNETSSKLANQPSGLEWRSSVWFVTLVVGMGVMTDIMIYSIVIPVFPFRLEQLGYTGVSALTGWLLFAFSAGLVITTIPVAWFSEHYASRRWPLVFGLLAQITAQIMLMLAPTYWVMCLSRVISGLSSSIVWVVGLAMLCETTPEAHIGQQLGFAMSGVSIGFTVGPATGGALYGRFGYRGPFIFGIIVCLADLMGRFLIIERKDAIKWGIDPAVIAIEKDLELQRSRSQLHLEQDMSMETEVVDEKEGEEDGEQMEEDQDEGMPRPSGVTQLTDITLVNREPTPQPQSIKPKPSLRFLDVTARTTPAQSVVSLMPRKPASLLNVVATLGKSRRAQMALFLACLDGMVPTMIEPSLPLHMQAVWGFNSNKVGLIYLATAVSSLISGPVTGWITDVAGAEWVSLLALILSIPWWMILIIRGPVALFVVSFALAIFVFSGIVSPVTAELAAVARTTNGVGYADVYGAFNIVYGIGNCVGPIIGGQLYAHLRHGWNAIAVTITGVVTLCAVLSVMFTGEWPLARRLGEYIKEKRIHQSA